MYMRDSVKRVTDIYVQSSGVVFNDATSSRVGVGQYGGGGFHVIGNFKVVPQQAWPNSSK